MLAQVQGAHLQVARELCILVGKKVCAHRWKGDGQSLQLGAVAECVAEVLAVTWGSRMRVPEAILRPRAVLKNAQCLARCLDNSHDAVDGNGGVAGQVELLKLGGGASNGEQVVVGNRHEVGVAKDLQSSQLAEVDRLQRLEIDEVVLVCGLLRRGVDTLELQGLEWLAGTGQDGSPGLGVHVPDGGPWKGKRGDVVAVLERLKHQAISLGGVEAVDPHALDLGSHLWVVVADAHSPLEGGKRVTVDGRASQAMNELVERVALSSVGEFCPSLYQMSV